MAKKKAREFWICTNCNITQTEEQAYGDACDCPFCTGHEAACSECSEPLVHVKEILPKKGSK